MYEQYAFNCYIEHYGASETHFCTDIAIAKHSVPEHDLLVGGVPLSGLFHCQEKSARYRREKEDAVVADRQNHPRKTAQICLS